jgi:hypothetical protein
MSLMKRMMKSMKTINKVSTGIRVSLQLIVLAAIWLLWVSTAAAASLSLSPSTGVYQANSTFSAQVVVNTQGQAINAADATLSFNPSQLAVVSVNRTGSIFNLWVTEPTFSNSAGTISFSGGLPSGYTGSAGAVMNVTFRAIGSGPARVNFSSGSVLANDGRGTNVLTTMNGGNYTILAASVAPEPEVVEYVPPANTPPQPVITSATHPDPDGWWQSTTAELTWKLPPDITAVRTLLDDNDRSIPTRVYDTPIDSITLEDLPEGEQYFHLQFRNADGWGRILHYRLGVDTTRPSRFDITQPEDNDYTQPEQTLQLLVEDNLSAVRNFRVRIDNQEPFDVRLDSETNSLTLPALAPGYHTVIIEAFDEAGNSTVSSYSFTIEAFERPRFLEFPSQLNEEVIPVIIGETRPNSTVTVYLQRVGSEANEYQVQADTAGRFTFIPDSTFSQGVYELSAQATDETGAVSERSEVIKIAVQQPGFIRIGGLVVSVLSIIIPLLALLIIGGFSLWYLTLYLGRYRKRVRRESAEALDILHREFATLQQTLRDQESALQQSRRTKKLTSAEAEMIEAFDKALQHSQRAVEKEIIDVEKITNRQNHESDNQ